LLMTNESEEKAFPTVAPYRAYFIDAPM
jgi:hypothetical protein